MASIAAHLLPRIPSEGGDRCGEVKVCGLGGLGVRLLLRKFHGMCVSRVSIRSDSRARVVAVVCHCRAKSAAGSQLISEDAGGRSTVVVPVTCYQLVGVPEKSEKDEIVKSVMELKGSEIEEGYTMDSVAFRQELLMDVRDKLLFEPEYAGNVKEKIPPKASLRIPWAWLPAALCLLQEVGEEKLVLDIGRATLQHPDAEPYVHDLLLSMALAECAIAKTSLEKKNVSLGFEALARAQHILRSKASLGKMTLLYQIEESLEELAPACTLEILGMPRTPENVERRRGAIAALRELLRQGLDVETSRQVHDWACFLGQAFKRLIAAEIVDILPWDNLAVIRKNKKSLESQNQRVVIDFNSFYTVLIAHIALGFSNKQTDLISKGKDICECLITSDGIDLKFEEAFCLLLLKKGEESEVMEKLQLVELNSNPVSRNSITNMDKKDVSSMNASLEIWLRDAVLSMFPDTCDSSPSLVNFFGSGKRTLKKQNVGISQVSTVNHRSLYTGFPAECRDIEEPIRHSDSSRHFGPAVKQLTPAELQSPFLSSNNASGVNSKSSSVQLKRNLGVRDAENMDSWLASRHIIGRITSVAVLGCIAFGIFKLSSMKHGRMRSVPLLDAGSLSWKRDSYVDHNVGKLYSYRNSFAGVVKELLQMVKVPLARHPAAVNVGSSCRAESLSSSVERKSMPIEEAEALVKQWQIVKAEALGPSHHVYSLSDVLDESMLDQWQALANAAKERSCFWRFVLLQLSVIRADIFSDKAGAELAEIEALLEEAAELVDDFQGKNPNYYSTYKIHYVLKRQDDGSWKFCECEMALET